MQKLEYDWISCKECLFKNMLCNSLLCKSLNESKFKAKWICGNSPKEIAILRYSCFYSPEVWSNTNILIDPYSSYFKPLKGTKAFHYNEIVSNKIHENVLYPDWPCHSSSTNENEDK